MGSRRVVGWMDDAEWEAVFCNLFYGSWEQIRTALDVIAVWRVRFAGRIPVAIEATTQLFESLLLKGDDNCMAKRQSMSAAISQFIGLLTERSLKGQLYATPIHVRGKELGIPEWVTMLRHDAAHGFMPTFTMLDKGVKFALEWLRVNHWEEHLRKQKHKRQTEESEAEEWNCQTSENFTHGSMEDHLSKLVRDYLAQTAIKSSTRKSDFGIIKSFMSKKDVSPDTLCTVLITNNYIPFQIDNERSKFYVGNKGQRLLLSSWARKAFTKIFLLLQNLEVLHLFLFKISQELRYPYTSIQLCTIWIDFLLGFFTDYTCPDYVWAEVITALIEEKATNQVIQKVIDTANFLGDMKYDPNYREQILVTLQPLTLKYNQDGIDESFVADMSYSETDEEALSWTLCGALPQDCPFGLMPGQDRKTLWKGLFCDQLRSAVVKKKDEACYLEDPITESQSVDSAVIESQDFFLPDEIEEFCKTVDLL